MEEREIMTTAEYIKLNVDEKIHSYARIYSSLLKDEFQRKRSYASLVALYSFVELLEQSPYSVQKSMTLFKNPQLNEQYEISDLYVNGWHIDVRVVTGGDAVLIPKTHFENDIAADFYVVVKVDSTLQNAELVGVVETENIVKEPFDYHYDAVPFSSLIKYDSFLAKLVIEKKSIHSEEEHELFKSSYLALLDNNLDNETKKKVVRHLFKCSICRTEFCCFTGFEMVCCNTSKYPEVLEDHTLGFVGAQNAEDSKYEGKEETIYIGSDQTEPEEKQETQEQEVVNKTDSDTNVSEILDDLFAMDEGLIQEETLDENLIESKEEAKEDNEIAETTSNEIESIDDILDEVTIETAVISVEETPDMVVSQEDSNKDLQMIDDTLFLDVPSKYPELETTQDGIQIIPEENVDPYASDENVELITNKENQAKKEEDDDELFVINEDPEEELVAFNKNEDNLIVEEDETSSGIVLIEDEIQEVYPSAEEFVINEDEDGIENIDDEIIDEATMLSQEEPVQKVIVDYDENGEPIYSYITDIEQEEKSSDENALIIDEEENEEFLEYKDDETTVSEIEDISDEQEDEEYESVYGDEEVTDDENETLDEETEIKVDDENEDEVEELQDEKEEINSENSVQETIEYSDDEPIEYYDEEEQESDEQPSAVDDVLYNNDDEDITREEEDYEEEYEEDSVEDEEEEDDEMIDYEDEDMNEDEDGEYDDYDVEDHLPEEQVKKSSSLFTLLIAIVVLLGLIGGGVFFFLNKNKSTEEEQLIETVNENVVEASENPAVNDMFEEPIETEQQENNVVQDENQQQTEQQSEQNANNANSMFEEQLPPPPENVPETKTASVPELTESDLIKPVERKSNGDVNKTIVNAFSTNASPVSLRALNWFCASELFSEINFKNYLQTVDNTLKQNLRNNFMGLVESSPKDSVAAKFAIDNRGNLKKAIISESSGSEEIDNVVLQSINETFEREKSQILNDNELKQDMYYLKVVIKL